ncbi:hypothetical protein UK15_00290 [Streptomyces variegatus]|uniref:Uncharacterized protein n=1 Tax=Streptomyces variegatus TaxID=284040 RepID=A0A0M2GYK1_9ACTN|nr:hypothetical protein UK15_00290 [Streptomyces variegatus]
MPPQDSSAAVRTPATSEPGSGSAVAMAVTRAPDEARQRRRSSMPSLPTSLHITWHSAGGFPFRIDGYDLRLDYSRA